MFYGLKTMILAVPCVDVANRQDTLVPMLSIIGMHYFDLQ